MAGASVGEGPVSATDVLAPQAERVGEHVAFEGAVNPHAVSQLAAHHRRRGQRADWRRAGAGGDAGVAVLAIYHYN